MLTNAEMLLLSPPTIPAGEVQLPPSGLSEEDRNVAAEKRSFQPPHNIYVPRRARCLHSQLKTVLSSGEASDTEGKLLIHEALDRTSGDLLLTLSSSSSVG